MANGLRKIICLLSLALFIVLNFFSPVSAQREGLVYVIPVHGEIDSVLPLSLKRAFTTATESEAKLIILEIDSFGGLVDASDKIKTAIYSSPVPVYAYVKKAISGGAFIALACERIYMHPGSTLGAVEPAPTDEKSLSVVEGLMCAMAERQGRDPLIASAMVRKEVAIPDLTDRGRLLTLTASMAEKVGYAEGIVNSYTEIPALAGIPSADFVVYSESAAVRFSRFISNPIVGAILLAIGLAALVIELFTAGFGIAGVISLLAFALFFGGNLLIGFAEWEYIAVFFVGIILLIAEAFIAGFGLLGVSGLIFIAISIVLSAETMKQGLLTLGLALLLSVVLIIIAFRFIRKSRLWNRLILGDTETKERGYIGPKDLSQFIGSEGVAVTPLRPSGTVLLSSGERLDAITDGSYIAVDAEISVIGISSGSVLVQKK